MLILAAAARFGDKVCLIFDDRRFSFRQIDDLSSALAAGLARQGIQSGDRVSLYAPNCPEWIIAYYGILKAGAVVNPLNLMLSPAEALYAMNDCGAVAVFGSSDKIAGIVPMLGDTQVKLCFAWGTALEEAMSFDTLLEPDSADWIVPDIDPLSISTVTYTSGTTGHPKGAELSHLSILLNTAMTATLHVRTPQDVVVSALPCSHVYGNIVMNAAIAYGMTLVLHQVFDADRIMQSIEQHRATLFEGVPTMYLYMLDSPRLKTCDFSSLTRCTVGGQTMSVAKMEQVIKALGCPLIELWGMTELGGLGATHSAYGPMKLGSIGMPLPHLQVRIVRADPSMENSGAGEVGELQIRGPMVMRGYLNRPDANKETITADGWLCTGDLARIDAEGYLYIVDRKKDLIITGGFNIYPAELERAILEHPDVAMVAVGRIPDAYKGEVAKAYVVMRPGAPPDAELLKKHCRERLAAYKVPRAFRFVDDLPRTSSGKILRRELFKLDIS